MANDGALYTEHLEKGVRRHPVGARRSELRRTRSIWMTAAIASRDESRSPL